VSKKWVIIMDRKQDSRRDFDSSRKKWTFGSELLLCHRFIRRREAKAWKRNRIEKSVIIAIVTD